MHAFLCLPQIETPALLPSGVEPLVLQLQIEGLAQLAQLGLHGTLLQQGDQPGGVEGGALAKLRPGKRLNCSLTLCN